MARHPTVQTDDFGIDTACLHGSLAGKLAASQEAGFTQVMLSSEDLVSHPLGVERAATEIRNSGLKIMALDGLDGFDGFAAGPPRAFKFEVAQAVLELCAAVRSPLLMVKASGACMQAADAQERLVEDLRRLALLAVPCNVRIAFEPDTDGSGAFDLLAALDMLQAVDMPNLGLGLAAARFSGSDLEDELEVGLESVYLVRLSDRLTGSPGIPAVPAAGFKVFPGDGCDSARLGETVKLLERRGYRGPWVFDVDHRDYRAMPTHVVAERARRSTRWLAEDVLRRSVPLPRELLGAHPARAQGATADPINNP